MGNRSQGTVQRRTRDQTMQEGTKSESRMVPGERETEEGGSESGARVPARPLDTGFPCTPAACDHC